MSKRPSESTRFEQDEALVQEQLTSNPLLIAEILKRSEYGQPKRRRVREPRPDLWESDFGRILQSEDIMDPSSKSGRLFRNRYRVPYNLFQQMFKKWKKYFSFNK